MIFSFAALLNAFGMASPVYAFEKWIAGRLGLASEAPVLGLIFGLFLVIEPAFLIGLGAWITKANSLTRRSLLGTAVRYSYCLVPLGFGVWLAHYSFHFLTGLFTFIPVAQNAVAELGWSLLGQPRWTLVGLPENVVQICEYGFLVLGLFGSLLVSFYLAKSEQSAHSKRIFATWAAIVIVLWGAGMWLLSQPMEMRGTMLGVG
jgi:hypothetical protein